MNDPSVPGMRSRRDALGLGAMSGIGLALAGTFLGSDRAHAAPATNAPLNGTAAGSAGVMEFGPDNVLFVGDIAGAAVYALRCGTRT